MKKNIYPDTIPSSVNECGLFAKFFLQNLQVFPLLFWCYDFSTRCTSKVRLKISKLFISPHILKLEIKTFGLVSRIRDVDSKIITPYPEAVAQIWLHPLRGFWGCWETFIFFYKSTLSCFFGLQRVFLASNSLHEVRGPKIVPMLNLNDSWTYSMK